MALGFLKKIAAIFTGKKETGDSSRRQQPKGQGSGRNQRRGGGKGQQQPRQQQEQKKGQRPQQQLPRGERQRQGQKGQAQQQRPNQDASRQGRGSRRGRRRGGAPAVVNTAQGQMRPGGEVSAEELAARKAAHAAWSPESFVVEPAEGKKRFHDFDLPSEVRHGIADLGFKYCTEIQALSLEQALAGKNIAGKAQTGSGKTAAFLVAILTRYLRTPESRAKSGGTPRALVIAPTRELVIQICKDADLIGKYCQLRSLAIYGGMDYVLPLPVTSTPGCCFCFSSISSFFLALFLH